MARKRQIDPDFFTDEEIAEFPFDGRYLYIGTWIHCEDTGVFEVKPRTLKGRIFAFDQTTAEDVQRLYEQIRNKGKFIEYVSGGGIFAFIKGFHKRQTIQYPSKSFLPLPPEPFLQLIPKKIRQLNDSSLSPLSVLTEESERIELNRIELNRVELKDFEIENLKKVYTNRSNLQRHLEGRKFKPELIDSVVNRIFPKTG